MSFIEGYIIFAFSTAFAVCYFWYWPLLVQAKAKNIKNSFTKRPKLSIVVYIIFSAIIAPLLVFPLINSEFGEAFERGLSKEVLADDPENY